MTDPTGFEERNRADARASRFQPLRVRIATPAVLLLFLTLAVGSCQQSRSEDATAGVAADTQQDSEVAASAPAEEPGTAPQPTEIAEAPTGDADSMSEAPAEAAPAGVPIADEKPADERATAPPAQPEAVPAGREAPATEPSPGPSPTPEPQPAPTATPADTPPAGNPAVQASLVASPEVYNGWKNFAANCERCHGQDVLGSALAPDLRRSVRESSVAGGGPLSRDAFIQTVTNGRLEKGMPPWGQILTAQQIQDLYAYVSARASGKLAPGRPTRAEN